MSVRTSFRDTDCEDCADLIAKDEPIYFVEGGKLCKRCAERDSLVCLECGGQKKPQFNVCWECKQGKGGSGFKQGTEVVGRLTSKEPNLRGKPGAGTGRKFTVGGRR